MIIAGDWMPVLLFNNNRGKLEDVSAASGLTNLNGMWSSLTADDVDGDGDIDFILGNCGYNDQFAATSKDQPLQMFVNDFDGNGTLDPIVCYYIQGKSYPMASRDEMLDQILPLRKKYIKYKDFADATINDMFSKEKLNDATVLYCDELASGILYNNGKNKFSFKPFPLQAQVSKVFGVTTGDYDNDGQKDILSVGNFFPYRVQLGRSDASLGQLLKGSSNDERFTATEAEVSGLFIDGDVRNMVEVKTRRVSG